MTYIKAETVAKLYERAKQTDPNLTCAEHANLLEMPYSVYMARLAEGQLILEWKHKQEFSLGTPLHLTGDYMICGDVHVPFTDYDFASLISLVGRKHLKKPRRLLLAGDFFNMDSFSQYPHIVNAPTWAQERDAARGLMDGWLSTFSEIVFLMGNHDRRLQKFVVGAFDETDIVALIKSNPERVKASNFGHCTIDSSGHVWRVTHPKNYSVNQLSVADALAQKYNQNVISFHEHHLSIGLDRYKRRVIVNGGALVDPDKLAYARLDDSKSAGMAKGFVMLRAGVAHLFGEHPFTDWARWV